MSGLTTRLAAVAALAVAVFAAVLGVLAYAVLGMRAETSGHRDAERVASAAGALQKSVLDLETGLRAYLLTRQERFLEPWRAARARVPREGGRLEQVVGATAPPGSPEMLLARGIRERADAYLAEHSPAVLRRAQARRASRADLVALVADGKRRVDELRESFAVLIDAYDRRLEARSEAVDRATGLALGGGIGGLALVVLAAAAGLVYLTRTVARPVAAVAGAADQIARGRGTTPPDLPAAGRAPREVRSLTSAFGAMVGTLEQQRAGLVRANAVLDRRVRERTADLEHARREALLMLASAAEYRDDDTHRHTERVGRNAALIGERLGLAPATVELLAAAAPLHDVGKIGVPDSILLKPGRLTDDEFEAIRRHAEIGASILGASAEPLFHVAAEIALTHHERWDGGGYPQGLLGDAIPLAGRIVAVVDVFDALTHERPYKPAWPVERARQEIVRGAGTQFDPAVVAAFEAIGAERLAADADDAALPVPVPVG